MSFENNYPFTSGKLNLMNQKIEEMDENYLDIRSQLANQLNSLIEEKKELQTRLDSLKNGTSAGTPGVSSKENEIKSSLYESFMNATRNVYEVTEKNNIMKESMLAKEVAYEKEYKQLMDEIAGITNGSDVNFAGKE